MSVVGHGIELSTFQKLYLYYILILFHICERCVFGQMCYSCLWCFQSWDQHIRVNLLTMMNNPQCDTLAKKEEKIKTNNCFSVALVSWCTCVLNFSWLCSHPWSLWYLRQWSAWPFSNSLSLFRTHLVGRLSRLDLDVRGQKLRFCDCSVLRGQQNLLNSLKTRDPMWRWWK